MKYFTLPEILYFLIYTFFFSSKYFFIDFCILLCVLKSVRADILSHLWDNLWLDTFINFTVLNKKIDFTIQPTD